MYELTAVLIHSGTAFSGHYFAYVLDPEKKQWLNFNDEVVTPLYSESVDNDFFQKAFGGRSDGASSASAYVLLYRRADPAPSDQSSAEVQTISAPLASAIATENQKWAKDRAE